MVLFSISAAMLGAFATTFLKATTESLRENGLTGGYAIYIYLMIALLIAAS
jgi:hypothetical protein